MLKSVFRSFKLFLKPIFFTGGDFYAISFFNAYAVTSEGGRLLRCCVLTFYTLEMLQAVVEAAEEVQSPFILQTMVGTVKHLGADYIAAAATVAAN